MTTDTPCCPKCLQPLHIVCDKHGEHHTTCRRVQPTEPPKVERAPAPAPAPVPAPTPKVSRGETVSRRLLSAFEGESRTLAELAARTGITYGHLSVELNAQLKKGTVRRVARGVYAKTTEGVSA